MPTIQAFIEAIKKDVNREDGYFLHISESITNWMFFVIKWAGIPFVLYILLEFFKR